MRALFAMDHRFEVDDQGQVYTLGGKYPYELWASLYLRVFDEIVVVGRGTKIQADPKKLSPSFGARVSHQIVGSKRGAGRLAEVLTQGNQLHDAVKNVDVVIGRLPSELGMQACAAARAAGKPYMVEVVASAWDGLWHHSSLAARAYAPVMELRTKQAVARSPAAIYVTEKFLQKSYPTLGKQYAASDVVIAPVSQDTLDERKMRVADAQRPIVFGTIGSLVSKMKGIHDAIKALAAVRAPGARPFIYRVLGEGDPTEYRALSEGLGLGDRVFFDGVLPAGDAVRNWLDGVDIYLQPSYQEGLPRALVEALSRGCIAIASTCGGIPEVLPPERLHAPGDIARLTTVIADVLGGADDALGAEIVRSSAFYDKYHPDVLMARRLEALRDLKEMVR